MTPEDITRLAHEAGFNLAPMENMLYTVRGNHAQLDRFAQLVKNHFADASNMVDARPLTDELMDCVDRLGSESELVDPRVWDHLLVYAPKKSNDHYKRILWDVCKNYGTAGECVFAGFKAALEKEAKCQ